MILKSLQPVASSERFGPTFWVFCVYTFILIARPQDYVPFLAPLRLALVFTILTCLVTFVGRRVQEGNLFRSNVTWLYLLLFVVMCAGIPFSVYRRGSFNFVLMTYVANIAFYLMFLAHVDSAERYKRVVNVVAVSTLVCSAAWFIQGGFRAGRYVTGSGMFDPNDVAFVEVALLPFALCVLAGQFGLISKALALLTVLLSVLLTLYTASRGGAIGLLVLFIQFLLVPIANVRRGHKLIILTCVVAVAMLNADKFNLERFSSLTDLGSDYNLSDEYGRTQVWKRGLKLLADSPLTGVGVSCFNEAVGAMRENEGLPPAWQAPHNSYIQVLVETGLPGGITFLLLIATCLANFNRYRKCGPTPSDGTVARFSALLLFGFTAQVVTAFFLSQAYSVLFSLYFAASAVQRQIVATGEETASCA